MFSSGRIQIVTPSNRETMIPANFEYLVLCEDENAVEVYHAAPNINNTSIPWLLNKLVEH